MITYDDPVCHQYVTNNQLQSFTYRSHTDSNICYMKPKISNYKYHITLLTYYLSIDGQNHMMFNH